jgi:hypothetical protein
VLSSSAATLLDVVAMMILEYFPISNSIKIQKGEQIPCSPFFFIIRQISGRDKQPPISERNLGISEMGIVFSTQEIEYSFPCMENMLYE